MECPGNHAPGKISRRSWRASPAAPVCFQETKQLVTASLSKCWTFHIQKWWIQKTHAFFWDLERSWQIENVSKEVVPTFPGDVPFNKLQSDVWQTIMLRKASHVESETCLDRCCKIVHYHLQGKPIPRSWFSLPISGWGTSKNAGLSQLSWALTRLRAEWHDRLMPHIQHRAGAQTTLGHRIELLPTFTAGREGKSKERDVVQAVKLDTQET